MAEESTFNSNSPFKEMLIFKSGEFTPLEIRFYTE
jgi:hypothetical protein